MPPSGVVEMMSVPYIIDKIIMEYTVVKVAGGGGGGGGGLTIKDSLFFVCVAFCFCASFVCLFVLGGSEAFGTPMACDLNTLHFITPIKLSSFLSKQCVLR